MLMHSARIGLWSPGNVSHYNNVDSPVALPGRGRISNPQLKRPTLGLRIFEPEKTVQARSNESLFQMHSTGSKKPSWYVKGFLVSALLLTVCVLVLPPIPLFKRSLDQVVRDCSSQYSEETSRVWITKVIGLGLTYLAGIPAHKYGKDNVIYPTQIVKLMNKFSRPVTLLDVGANVGYITFPVLAMKPMHRVIAVEPVNENVARLCQAATLNGWASGSRLTVVKGAVSDSEGEMTIYVPKGRADNAALSATAAVLNVGGQSVPEKVRLFQGDALLKRLNVRPDIVKIDTQGHGLHVMRGLRNFLREKRDVLVFAESDTGLMKKSGVNPKDIWRLMVDELGFEVYSSEAKVSIVDNKVQLSGITPLKADQFPPRASTDLYFIRPRSSST